MILKVHYPTVNITQYLTVVEHSLYLLFKELRAIIPLEDDPKTSKIVMEWNNLSSETQHEIQKQFEGLEWIGKMKKDGKMCTTQSPIYESFVRGDGVLKLPIHQGGDHVIEILEFKK